MDSFSDSYSFSSSGPDFLSDSEDSSIDKKSLIDSETQYFPTDRLCNIHQKQPVYNEDDLDQILSFVLNSISREMRNLRHNPDKYKIDCLKKGLVRLKQTVDKFVENSQLELQIMDQAIRQTKEFLYDKYQDLILQDEVLANELGYVIKTINPQQEIQEQLYQLSNEDLADYILEKQPKRRRRARVKRKGKKPIEQLSKELDEEIQSFKAQLESCKVLKSRVQPNISSQFMKYVHSAIKPDKQPSQSNAFIKMGVTCGICSGAGKVATNQTYQSKFSYNKSQALTLKVKKSFSTDENPLINQKTVPSVVFKDSVEQDGFQFTISGCVIPGEDPQSEQQKVCQDLCFYQWKNNVLLLALYDGHGQYGDQVVQFCEQLIRLHFENKVESYEEFQPQIFLKEMTKMLEDSFESCHIDVSLSGSTQILAIIYQNRLFVASLGDSHGILTSNSKTLTNQAIDYRLVSKPLTVAHTPSSMTEKVRVERAGGVIQRLKDQFGNMHGPERVWNKDRTTPGLAMTRSLGDSIAKRLGCSSIPSIKSVNLRKLDNFIILGSDGIWDVLLDEQVAEFAAFKKQQDEPNIAKKIAKYARSQWIQSGINQGGIIDDISCLVVEISVINQTDLLEFQQGTTQHFIYDSGEDTIGSRSPKWKM